MITATSVHELLDWLAAIRERGVVRFELWAKPRNGDQQPIHAFDPNGDPWNIADEAFTTVQRDRRAEQGLVTYAVFGFREGEAVAVERAFIAPPPSVLAIPVVGQEAAAMGPPRTSLDELVTVLHPMLGTVQSTLALLQRENEHQRKSNEIHVRTESGHFDALARGYERTISEMERRIDDAQRENRELREQLKAAEARRLEEWHAWQANADETARKVEELGELKTDDLTKAQRKMTYERLATDVATFAAPLLVSLATKTPLLGASNAVLQRFLESISPDQLKVLHQILTPTQQAVLMAFMGQASRSATSEAAPAEGPSPQGTASTEASPATAEGGQASPSPESVQPGADLGGA